MKTKECQNCKENDYRIITPTCAECVKFSNWKDVEGMINGVAEEEMVSNRQGGKQSKLEYRFDLIDTKAIFKLAHVLHTGEIRYGKDNWRKIDADSHLNHALSHIYAYLAGDGQDRHLDHAFCRLMMAIGVERGGI